MPFITWDTAKFSVNIKHLDNHHQVLFNLINKLYDAMKEGKSKDVLGKILVELSDYTVYHFKAEEELFQKYGYPEYAQHKKEHEDFIKKVLELKAKFDKGTIQAALSIETMEFLKSWLNNHICIKDKKYGPFLNSKGVV